MTDPEEPRAATESIHFVHGTEAGWLAERKRPVDNWLTTLTATDAAKICGVSKYGGPLDVWLEKTGQGANVEPSNAEQLESGHRMQRAILDWYGDRERREVEHHDRFSFTRSGVVSLIGASLDALARPADADWHPADAKNIGYPKPEEWGEPGTDQMPEMYAVQLVIQMFVVPRSSYAHLVPLVRGQDLRVYPLLRDDQLEQNIIGRCVDFHEKYIRPVVPPPVDGSESWTKYLTDRFKANTEGVIKAPAEMFATARRLHALNAQLDALKIERDEAANIIKAAIGDGRTISEPRWDATYAFTKDSVGTNWEGVAKDMALAYSEASGQPHGELLKQKIASNQHVTRRGSRRFTFNFHE